MNSKNIFSYLLLMSLIFSFTFPLSQNAFAKSNHKKRTSRDSEASSGDAQAAANATNQMVHSLDLNNSQPVVSTGTTPVKSPEDLEAEKARRRALAERRLNQEIKQQGDYINTRMKFLSDNENASWIFKTSVDSINTVFKNGEIYSEEDMVRTLKQTACVFIAETRYGNLGDNGAFDKCDQTNIGQIRPPAYKAIFDRCQMDFGSNDLAFLSKGTTCQTLHPYELPLCCNALSSNETSVNCSPKITKGRGKKKSISVDKSQIDNPKYCVSKEKRQFLETADFMSATSMTNVDLADGKADAITCKSTSGENYVRVPAYPEHSVFAGIYYLKIVGYQPMSDSQFASFGANSYNGAGTKERRGYQRKLNACLKIMNQPENSEIIRKAYQRAISTRSLSDTKQVEFENSPKSDQFKDKDGNYQAPNALKTYPIKAPTLIKSERIPNSDYMRVLQGRDDLPTKKTPQLFENQK
jgi:hypothetical protein